MQDLKLYHSIVLYALCTGVCKELRQRERKPDLLGNCWECVLSRNHLFSHFVFMDTMIKL